MHWKGPSIRSSISGLSWESIGQHLGNQTRSSVEIPLAQPNPVKLFNQNMLVGRLPGYIQVRLRHCYILPPLPPFRSASIPGPFVELWQDNPRCGMSSCRGVNTVKGECPTNTTTGVGSWINKYLTACARDVPSKWYDLKFCQLEALEGHP